MLGLFFERLNNRFKKPDDKLKEDSLVSTVQPSRETFSPYNYSNITSISPTVYQSQLQSHLHPSHQGPAISDVNARNTHFDQRRMRNPSPIHSKRLEDDKGFLNATYSAGFTRNDNLRQTGNFGPNFQEKDSFMQNTGSILESTKEGSFLAQNIPTSKLITASKYNKIEDTKAPQTLQFVNKLGGEKFDVRAPLRRDAEDVLCEKENSQMNDVRKAWQDWWGEKKKNNCLLLEASKLGNVDVCKRLLDKSKGDLRGDVNCKGDNGWTPFHFACLNGNIDIVNLFLYNEADIDTETTLKYTPLHIAAQKGFAEITQLLINSGADFNSKDIFNNTPLHYAAQSGQKDIVEIFLSRPSMDLNIKNNDNKLAYDLADEREIRKTFETFMAEKNLLNSKCTQKVTIHAIKSETMRRIFEAPSTTHSEDKEKQPIKGVASTKPPIKRIGEPDIEEKKVFSHRSNTGETKANSSLNSSGSENANNANISGEEEKVGPKSFKVHGLIGKGSFGEVYLVEKKNSLTYYAMKVLHKSKITKHNLINYARTERNVLGLTNHPFIVKLKYAFQTPEKLFLILDYCPNGDLGEHLQREKKFSEEKARFYLAEVILALADLHKRDIIFRDLKPDNIVIDAEGHAKLTDFGLSKEGVLEHAHGARSFCGSVAYLAPEMLKRAGHGKAVDWYLLGVVFYEMLVGIPPYYTNNREQLFHNIEKAPLKVPANLSSEAKALLKGLLQRNPAKRLGSGRGDAEEIKAHDFFKDIDWKEAEQRKLKPPTLGKRTKVINKVTYDIFELDPMVSENEGKVTGWSFVASQGQVQEQTQTLDKRFL